MTARPKPVAQEVGLDQGTETADLLRSDARIVDWYRLDQNARIVRVMAVGAALMGPGSCLVAFGVVPLAVDEGWRAILTIAGCLCVLGGPVWTILGLRNVMRVDSYLVLRTDGLVCHLTPEPRLLLWEDIMEIQEDQGVTLVLRDETTFRIRERLNGIDAATLGMRLRDVRRKALFGLLRF